MRALLDDVVEIRPATDADGTFLYGLAELAFAEFDAHAGVTTMRLTAEARAQTRIAMLRGEPVGFAILNWEAPRSMHLSAIAVVASERGQGIGQCLLQDAERYAAQQGAEQVTLTTAQANLAALDLFLRCGFGITRRSRGGYSRVQPTCRLEKRLVVDQS